jgi:hypothetical protein
VTRAEERLHNPPPGSRVEAAREFGIDLTLLIERLRRTPEERVRDLQQAIRGLESMRGAARKRRPSPAESVAAAEESG